MVILPLPSARPFSEPTSLKFLFHLLSCWPDALLDQGVSRLGFQPLFLLLFFAFEITSCYVAQASLTLLMSASTFRGLGLSPHKVLHIPPDPHSFKKINYDLNFFLI